MVVGGGCGWEREEEEVGSGVPTRGMSVRRTDACGEAACRLVSVGFSSFAVDAKKEADDEDGGGNT